MSEDQLEISNGIVGAAMLAPPWVADAETRLFIADLERAMELAGEAMDAVEPTSRANPNRKHEGRERTRRELWSAIDLAIEAKNLFLADRPTGWSRLCSAMLHVGTAHAVALASAQRGVGSRMGGRNAHANRQEAAGLSASESRELWPALLTEVRQQVERHLTNRQGGSRPQNPTEIATRIGMSVRFNGKYSEEHIRVLVTDCVDYLKGKAED